jgi:hypothetical protein
MEDTNTHPSNDFQKKVDALAESTEQKLREVGYRLVLSPSKDFHRDSEWAMLVAGGSLALMVPNLKDLLEVYPSDELQLALALLLISGVLGFLAKSVYANMEKRLSGPDADSTALLSVITGYLEQFKKIREDATAAGQEVKDELDYGIFLKPVKEQSPTAFRMVAKEYHAREKDPDHGWKKIVKADKLHTSIVVVQLGLILLGFGVLLVGMKKPNQAAEPTRAIVSPPADAGASASGARGSP